MTTTSIFEQIAHKLNSGVAVAIDCPSCEELRILEGIATLTSPASHIPHVFVWDVTDGLRAVTTSNRGEIGFRADSFTDETYLQNTPDKFLGLIRSQDSIRRDSGQERDSGIFVLLDAHKYINGATGDPAATFARQRVLKTTIDELATSRITQARRIILVGENLEIPPELNGRVEVIKILPPTGEEIGQHIRAVVDLPNRRRESGAFRYTDTPEFWARLVRAAQGLPSVRQIGSVVREAISAHSELGESTIAALHDAKVERLKQSGLLVASEPDVELGGITYLRQWLTERSSLLTKEAGDDRPRGILLTGHPGTGKSLLAKTAGEILGCPVIQLQPSAFLDKYVGGSESKTAHIFALVEASAPCVLWIDEVEKMFGGAGDNDGGTTRRVFGQFLTWMNDCAEPVFLVATANDISALPSEFLRAGRFDEIFRIDLPDELGRAEILELHLAKRLDRGKAQQFAGELAIATHLFSGAELAAIVKGAAISAKSQGRILELDGLLAVASKKKPLAVVEAAKFSRLEQAWADLPSANTGY
jgi:hypothetical protein